MPKKDSTPEGSTKELDDDEFIMTSLRMPRWMHRTLHTIAKIEKKILPR